MTCRTYKTPEHCFIIKVVLAAAVLLTSGTQWSFLQTFAWLNMTVSFSQEMSVGRAIERTFSGKFPCRICLLVERVNEQESESAILTKVEKHDWLNGAVELLLYPPDQVYPSDVSAAFTERFQLPPPLPPPKFLHS